MVRRTRSQSEINRANRALESAKTHGIDDKDAGVKEIALAFFGHEMKRVEYYESSREKTTAILFSISSGLFAVLTIQKSFDVIGIYIGSLIFIVDVFGVVFSVKHYLRSRYHYERARAYRDFVDSKYLNGLIGRLREDGKENFYERFNQKKWASLIGDVGGYSAYWVVMPLIVASLGITIMAISYFQPHLGLGARP